MTSSLILSLWYYFPNFSSSLLLEQGALILNFRHSPSYIRGKIQGPRKNAKQFENYAKTQKLCVLWRRGGGDPGGEGWRGALFIELGWRGGEARTIFHGGGDGRDRENREVWPMQNSVGWKTKINSWR